MKLSDQNGMSSLNSKAMLDRQSLLLQRVTSGLRYRQTDDTGGLSASQGRVDSASFSQAARSASDGTSRLEKLDAGLTDIGKMLERMSKLATEAVAQGNDAGRSSMNTEFQALAGEVDRYAARLGLNTGGESNRQFTVYGGSASGRTADDAVTVDLSKSAMDMVGLGLATTTTTADGQTTSTPSVDLSTAENAEKASAAVSEAMGKLSTTRSIVSRGQSQLEYAIRDAASRSAANSTSESRMRDVDLSQETNNASRMQVLMQTARDAMRQASNQSPQNGLALLG